MNNYSSPRIIRILNKLDTYIGIVCISMLTVLFTPRVDALETWIHRFTLLLITFLVVYCIIGLAKICSYVYCIFQGYRVTLLGMILYSLWILGISIVTAMLIVSIIIDYIEMNF